MNVLAARRRRRLQVGASTVPTTLAAVTITLVGFVQGLVGPQLLGCVLLAMVGASWLAVRRPPRLSIWVDMPQRITVGEAFDTTVNIVTEGRVRRRTIRVIHRLQGAHPLAVDGAMLVETSKKHMAIRLTRTPFARGASTCSELDVVVAGPFGFFSSRSVRRTSDEVLSLPAKSAPLELARLRHARDYAGVELSHVRDWRAGDAAHDVHWRSSMRTGRLAVIQREQEARTHCAIVVMAGPAQHRHVTDRAFEHAVSLVAATAVAHARRGEPICLVNPGSGGVVHGTNSGMLLDHLARLDAIDAPSEELLSHAVKHAGRGGVVLLVADSSTPPSWKSRLLALASASDAEVFDVGEMLRRTPRTSDRA